MKASLSVCLLLLALVSSCRPSPTGPTGIWKVETTFQDGKKLVSTCHSEHGGRVVKCEPPLPFKVTGR